MLNTATIEGRLVHDAQVKEVNESKVFKFTIAYNHYASGSSTVHYFECEIWSNSPNQAQFYEGNLIKGVPVIVEGMITQHKYTAKDGTNKSKTIIKGRNLSVFGRRPETQQKDESPFNYTEDTIPF